MPKTRHFETDFDVTIFARKSLYNGDETYTLNRQTGVVDSKNVVSDNLLSSGYVILRMRLANFAIVKGALLSQPRFIHPISMKFVTLMRILILTMVTRTKKNKQNFTNSRWLTDEF